MRIIGSRPLRENDSRSRISKRDSVRPRGRRVRSTSRTAAA